MSATASLRVASTEADFQLRYACLRSAASLLGFSSRDMLIQFVKSVRNLDDVKDGREIVAIVKGWYEQYAHQVFTEEIKSNWSQLMQNEWWGAKIRPLPDQELSDQARKWVPRGHDKLTAETIPGWEILWENVQRADLAADYMTTLFQIKLEDWSTAFRALVGSEMSGVGPTGASANIGAYVDAVKELANMAHVWGSTASDMVIKLLGKSPKGTSLFVDQYDIKELSAYTRTFARDLSLSKSAEKTALVSLPSAILAHLNADRLSKLPGGNTPPVAHWSSIWIMFLQNRKPTRTDLVAGPQWRAWEAKARAESDMVRRELFIPDNADLNGVTDPGLLVVYAFTFGEYAIKRQQVQSAIEKTRPPWLHGLTAFCRKPRKSQ